MKKSKNVYLITSAGCPPCQYVKKNWVKEIEKFANVTEISSTDFGGVVEYIPYFFKLSDDSEMITLNSNSLSELIKDINNA
jgi:hypothetical protein